MKIITSISTKGGVGKTTTLVGLAMVAAQMGKKIHLIDTDPNAPMSKLEEAGTETGYWNSNVTVSKLFGQDASELGVLSDQLDDNGTDYVFLDTKGGEGPFALACLQLSDFIIVPTALTKSDVDGAENTLAWIQEIVGDGYKLPPYRTLISQMPTSSNLSVGQKQQLEDLIASFPLLQSTIPPNKTLANYNMYGLFHKVIEDLKSSGKQIDALQARHFQTVLLLYRRLLEEIEEEIKING